MSKAATSPTARLLQSSRLFSLPRPLPQPALETTSSTGIYRASDTATLPYPTHQAIATPPSSHFRGDWGLKRALPAKATRGTSTPHIRVSAQDTPEHITDFGSAADHTLTAAKWAEMGVPMLWRSSKTVVRERSAGQPSGNTGLPPYSAFEDFLDQTDGSARAEKGAQVMERWKHEGPWLAGMQDGEFERFLRNLGKRRGADGGKSPLGRSKVDQWREFLRQHETERRVQERRLKARQDGEGALDPAELEELRQTLRPTDAELTTIEKNLRDDHATAQLGSRLTALIAAFLDLPAVTPDGSALPNPARDRGFNALIDGLGRAEDIPPPSTHPSAGLSYLRTAAIMENHPIHGPQAHRAPVLARVVRPRSSAHYQAALGVGGVVTLDPISATNAPRDKGHTNELDPNTMAAQLDPDLEGGNKMWVHPLHASVDEQGRIMLQVTRGMDEAVKVKTGDVEGIHEARAANARSMGSRVSAALPGTAGNANYGKALPDQRYMRERPARNPVTRRREEVRGFDELVGAEGRLSDESSMSKIYDLLGQERRRGV